MSKKTRSKYTKQFKTDAVKLVLDQGIPASEVSRSLDIGSGSLQRWVREYKKLQNDAFSGKGRMTTDLALEPVRMAWLSGVNYFVRSH